MKLQEALGLIPDSNIAQRALELAVENSLNKDVPDCATALESGFLFPVTSEGASYWRSVVDALRSGNDIPPLPFIASRHDKKTEGSSLAEGARALDERTRVYSDTASLPPFPPAPDGMQWVHVPEGLVPEGRWSARQDTVWAWTEGIDSQWHVCEIGSICGRVPVHLFAKLIPIVAAPAPPAELPPYPEAPTQCASQCAETCTPNPESGDIAQETAQTPPLQLRVGGYYRRRGGSTCCITTEREGATYCFSDEDGYGYTCSGRYIGDHVCHDLDIMEEVPAPALPPF